MMNKIFLITALFLFSLLVACEPSNDKNATKVDSVKTAKSGVAESELDTFMSDSDRPDDEQQSPTQAEEREKLIKSYDDTLSVDTTLILKDDTIIVHLRYYCLKASELIIPKIYDYDTKNHKKFETHEFACDAKMLFNGRNVFEKTILKSDFNAIIDDELKKYSTLQTFAIHSWSEEKKQVRLDFSISIPSTDVGVGVSLYIDKGGNSKIQLN